MRVQRCDGGWSVGMGCQAEAIAANTGVENLEGQHLFSHFPFPGDLCQLGCRPRVARARFVLVFGCLCIRLVLGMERKFRLCQLECKCV
jgi:hypothetical protein